MTKQSSFKKAVRRHAADTGQRYTEAREDLEGVDTRVFHSTTADSVAAHLERRYGIEVSAVEKLGAHNEVVYRVEHHGGPPWVARVFPRARPKSRVSADASILAFLARQGYPAERLAVEEPISEFDGQQVLLTLFEQGAAPDPGHTGFATWGRLLGRLHALELDEEVSRDGGAFGHDPAREGRPAQDLLAARTYLKTIDGDVEPAHRARYENLCAQVASADDARGLPDALVHGDLVDHVVGSGAEAVAIHWQASGRGARLADLAYVLWMTLGDQANVDALIGEYRQHVTLTGAELDRLPAVLMIKPLYLVAWYYWRFVAAGHQPTGEEGWWNFISPTAGETIATATRRALER